MQCKLIVFLIIINYSSISSSLSKITADNYKGKTEVQSTMDGITTDKCFYSKREVTSPQMMFNFTHKVGYANRLIDRSRYAVIPEALLSPIKGCLSQSEIAFNNANDNKHCSGDFYEKDEYEEEQGLIDLLEGRKSKDDKESIIIKHPLMSLKQKCNVIHESDEENFLQSKMMTIPLIQGIPDDIRAKDNHMSRLKRSIKESDIIPQPIREYAQCLNQEGILMKGKKDKDSYQTINSYLPTDSSSIRSMSRIESKTKSKTSITDKTSFLPIIATHNNSIKDRQTILMRQSLTETPYQREKRIRLLSEVSFPIKPNSLGNLKQIQLSIQEKNIIEGATERNAINKIRIVHMSQRKKQATIPIKVFGTSVHN